MASLNEDFIEWFKEHISKHPAANFSKGCTHYGDHAKDINNGKYDSEMNGAKAPVKTAAKAIAASGSLPFGGSSPPGAAKATGAFGGAFGGSSGSPKSTPFGGSFGAGKTAAPAFGAAAKTSPPSASFGGAAKTSPSTPFGGAAKATSPSAPFGGAAKATSPSTAFGGSKPAAFGGDSKAAAPTFGAAAKKAPAFGGATTDAAPAFNFGGGGGGGVKAPPAPFTFGAKKDEAAPAFGGAKKDSAPAFGGAAKKDEAAPFSFGVKPAAAAAAFGGDKKNSVKKDEAAPAFSFGASSSAAPAFGAKPAGGAGLFGGAGGASGGAAPAAFSFGAKSADEKKDSKDETPKFSFGASSTPVAAPAAGGMFGGAASFGAAAPGAGASTDAGGDDEETEVAPEDESTKDDAPVQTALNDGEKVLAEMRCKAFVMKDGAWSDRGKYTTRVVENTAKGYGSFVVKQETAPFKVLVIDTDANGDPVGGVNFKISGNVPIKKDGKTLSVMLPGKDKPSRYMLRFKGPKETDEVYAAVEKFQK